MKEWLHQFTSVKNDALTETWKLPLSVSLSPVAQEEALFADTYNMAATYLLTLSCWAFSIAAGQKDNKPIIFAMKHIPLLSSPLFNH